MPEIRTSVTDSTNLKKDRNSFVEKYEKAKSTSNPFLT